MIPKVIPSAILLAAALICNGGYTAIADSSDENPSYILCRNQKTVRTVKVNTSEGGQPCTTIYTKGGMDKVVGSGSHDISCYRILKNIKNNLEGASWSCKDVSRARFSLSESVKELQ